MNPILVGLLIGGAAYVIIKKNEIIASVIPAPTIIPTPIIPVIPVIPVVPMPSGVTIPSGIILTNLNQSLLYGATPKNFVTPLGWKVERTQDFENVLGIGEFIWGSITTANSHSGTKSVGGIYNSSSQAAGWGIEVFSGREVYVSWWEYLDSTFRNNDEMLEFHMLHNNPFQEVITDWYYNTNGDFNTTTGRMVVVSNGPRDKARYDIDRIIPVGVWHQWEVWYRPNNVGVADGRMHIYLNGILIRDITDDLNGNVDMINSRLSIGGTYTKLIWRKPDNSCGLFIGDGTTPSPTVCNNFNNCPCLPNPPIFNRYLDDIIVMVPQ